MINKIIFGLMEILVSGEEVGEETGGCAFV